ncbi:hypothetical protein HYW20_00145 [Candidatus Woesearchaeota archaeon]|nr:hypothetical protein [Candidatus Woesearchaeota archaeon]
MKIAIDSCSIILLAKASVLEAAANKFKLIITNAVYEEILNGKNRKFVDALLTEKLVREKMMSIRKVKNKKIIKRLMGDFNLGLGEAEVLALTLEKQCSIISTDNKQGRKAAAICNLSLVGSIDIIVSLYRLKSIDSYKAIDALKKLREFGWFQDYLIDNAMKEVGDA